MDLIEEAKHLFGNEPRPTHFTNFKHCDECAEHDETLRNETPDSLRIEQLNPAWDPMCSVSVKGFKYYFPALVRLALEGTGQTYFIDQLIFHLEYDGKNNVRYQGFSIEQRAYVVRVLEFLVENRAHEIEANLDTDALFRAISIWSDDSAD